MPVPLVLSVWVFPQPTGAQRAVHPLARAAQRHLTITDAGVVAWRSGSPRPVAWQEPYLFDDRRLSGAFWGLLFGSLFLLPLAQPATAAKNAQSEEDQAIACWLQDVGVGPDMVAPVRAAVRPGASALFIFELTDDDESLHRAMPAAARQVARHQLTVQQAASLHAAFDDD